MKNGFEPNIKNERVTTALLLAAGTGTRLSPLTDMAIVNWGRTNVNWGRTKITD